MTRSETATAPMLDNPEPTDQGRLDVLTAALIRQPDLDDWFSAVPGRPEALRQALNRAVADYDGGEPEGPETLHRTLASLYEMHVLGHHRLPSVNQFDPTLAMVMRELERAWERFESHRTVLGAPPADPDDFCVWMKEAVTTHPATDHPLFRFLEEEATAAQLRHFFRNESAVDTRFDDLVALMQVGMDGPMKMELAENYWDEMGNGEACLVHTTLFEQLIHELEATTQSPGTVSDPLCWQSFACGNLLLQVSLNRRLVHRALGAMGTIEMAAPTRFRRLVRGFERLGISHRARTYHLLHIAIDTRHGSGWLHNAVGPTVAAAPDARFEIARGMLARLNTSADYCDCLLAAYTREAGTDHAAIDSP